MEDSFFTKFFALQEQINQELLNAKVEIIQAVILAGIYLLKVNNRNTRTRCEICSKLTIKTSERCKWHLSGIFTLNFEHISHLALVFLLATLNMYLLRYRILHYKNVQWFNKTGLRRNNITVERILDKPKKLNVKVKDFMAKLKAHFQKK